MMKKCLITGASGLVGNVLVEQLKNFWHLYLIQRQSSPIVEGIEGVPCDLSKDWNQSELPSQMDAVIHLAHSEHFHKFPEGAEEIFQTNTMSTLRLLDYARKAGATCFILASTGGVYGYGNTEFVEDQEILVKEDLGFYQCSKLSAEMIAETFTPFMNVVILRFFFIYGPGQRKTRLIPRLVHTVQQEQPIQLRGTDGIRINPLYVIDAANATARALTLNKSEKINVGGPHVYNLRQVGECIGKIIGKKPQFIVEETLQPHHLVGNTQKMNHLLGQAQFSFQEGIQLYLKTLSSSYFPGLSSQLESNG